MIVLDLYIRLYENKDDLFKISFTVVGCKGLVQEYRRSRAFVGSIIYYVRKQIKF